MRRAARICLLGLVAWAAPASAATTYVAGADLVAGDVVTFDAAGEVVTTTAADDVVVGVVFQAASTGQSVPVETTDDITVKVTAGTLGLRYLSPSATPGVAVGSTTPTATTFGYSRTAESGGTCSMQFLRVGGATGGGVHPVDLATDVTGTLAEASIDSAVARDSEIPTHPVDLATDVTGTLAEASIDSAVARDSEIPTHPVDLVTDVSGVLDETNVDPAVARDTELLDGKEDNALVKTDLSALDVGRGLDLTNPDGTRGLITPDPEEIEGVAISELIWWLPFDDSRTLDPEILMAHSLEIAPQASLTGWFDVWRLDGDAHDSGAGDVHPADGTALPSGVTGTASGPTPLAVDFGGDGSANNFLDITGDPPAVIATTEGWMWIVALNEAAVDDSGTFNVFDSWDIGSTSGVALILDSDGAGYLNGNYRVLQYDGTTFRSLTNATALDDGTDKWVVVNQDTTNWTLYINGTQDKQVSDARTGNVDFGQGTVAIGGSAGATTTTMNGQVGYFAMFEGIVPADFIEYLNNLAAADRELIGDRYMQGKFAQGRLFIGNDYERYDDELFRVLRHQGTVMGWVQPIMDSDTTTVTADCVVFEQITSGSEKWRFEFDPDATTPQWIATITAGSSTVTAALTTTSGDAFADGQWIHVAMSWDQANLKLYVDGVLAESTALGSEPLPTGELGSTCTFGNSAAGGEVANMVLDHLKAAPRALTPAEIANDAAATRP